MADEKKKWDYSEYYDRNRNDINRKRRERYAKDQAYRDKVVKSAVEAKSKKVEERGGKVVREYEGQEVLGYRIGTAAQMLGKSVPTLRFWESEGLIPKPIFEGFQRVYTVFQVTLMQNLVLRLNEAEEKGLEEVRKVKEEQQGHIHQHWKGGL